MDRSRVSGASWLRYLLLMVIGALLLLASAEIIGAWRNWSDIDPGSGTWTGLANDLAHGSFYRPVRPTPSFDGYGGTRYMPLYFVLDAALIRMGVGVVNAGISLSVAAGIGLVLGTYRLLRELRIERLLAGCSAVLIVASGAVQSGFTATRGDLLAACFNVWGIACCLSWRRVGHCSSIRGLKTDTHESHALRAPSRGALWFRAAVACFVLAFMTKLTSVCGTAACLIWLTSSRQWRAALKLGAAIAFLAIACALLSNLASQGRMAESFRACASGGTSWHFASAAPRRALSMLTVFDPSAGMTLLAAVACAMAGARQRKGEERARVERAYGQAGLLAAQHDGFSTPRPAPASQPTWPRAASPCCVPSLPLLNLLLTALVTLAIYASPGTHRNHLIELHSASVLFVVWSVARGKTHLAPGLAVMCVLGAWGVAQTAIFFRQVRTPFDRQAIQATVAEFRADRGPVLSENGIFSVLCGEARPYVIDSFSFALLSRNDRTFAAAMEEALRHHHFSAVVLQYDPTSETGRIWYRNCNFGPSFIEHLLRNYHVAALHGSYCTLRPNR